MGVGGVTGGGFGAAEGAVTGGGAGAVGSTFGFTGALGFAGTEGAATVAGAWTEVALGCAGTDATGDGVTPADTEGTGAVGAARALDPTDPLGADEATLFPSGPCPRP